MNKNISRFTFILFSIVILSVSIFYLETNDSKEDTNIKPIVVEKVSVNHKVSSGNVKAKKIPDEFQSSKTVWCYLKKQGFSDKVSSGILGNMMAECGGQSLKLNHNNYSLDGKYYGLCQWSSEYYPDVLGKGVVEQLDFLISTIKKEFDMFGSAYGYSYDDFKNITDEREAALVFAQIYERCYVGTYSVRQDNAIIAYNYFKNF